MIVHRIQDLSNEYVVALLKQGLSQITDPSLYENYSPDLSDKPANLFYVLHSGRYKNGAYFVVENNGEYVCSAGWNEYTDEIGLVLTRAFVSKSYRTTYPLAEFLLPTMIEETKKYKHTWITCNKKKDTLYQWFVRSHEGKSPAIFNNWPEIYKKFIPVGEKYIYFTEQLVAELKRE